jgi:hypothetical protein
LSIGFVALPDVKSSWPLTNLNSFFLLKVKTQRTLLKTLGVKKSGFVQLLGVKMSWTLTNLIFIFSLQTEYFLTNQS